MIPNKGEGLNKVCIPHPHPHTLTIIITITITITTTRKRETNVPESLRPRERCVEFLNERESERKRESERMREKEP